MSTNDPVFDATAPRDCLDCGRPIGDERRAAHPDALRCVRCESEHSRLQAKPLTQPAK